MIGVTVGRLRNRRGMALVTVLWAVALLTIMAGSFSLSLQRDNNLVKFNEERARGAALADAAVHFAMFKVGSVRNGANMNARTGEMQNVGEGSWRSDGVPCAVSLPSGQAEVRVFDETGKVNLNVLADPSGTGLPVLRTVLAQAFDGDQDRADRFADAIMDWVDPDQLTRPNGAEADDYESANKGYAPPDRKFEALEELLMVMVNKETGETLTPRVFKRLEPLLTVYSTGMPGININKASRAVLATLPLQCMDSSAAMQHWQMRGDSCFELPQGQQQANPLMQGAQGMLQPGGVACAQGNTPGQIFTVYAYTRTNEGQVTTVKAVVSKRMNRDNNGSPFTFLSWKQLPSSVADASEPDSGLSPH